MFRPIRTLMLLGAVFLAGLGFEKYKHSERCTAIGGSVSGGICQGGAQ
ncbi:MAG: hypothetical protein WAO78_15855 [Roseovarius sp.]